MNVASQIDDCRAIRRTLASPVGFVPTMGAIHDGHLALVRRARAESASVVVSIFVNPAQFGPGEDYGRYPRDLDADLSRLEVEDVDMVFAPPADTLYPPGFDTWVEVRGLSDRLEGAARPGHFRGVATVIVKLLHIVQPDRAYFGQKDAQQTILARRLVEDLDIPVEPVIVPTVREPDGLAMSSRNAYLTLPERRAATALHRSLRAAEDCWRGGERRVDALRRAAEDVLSREPLVRTEYVCVASADRLETLETVDRPAFLLVAARIGRTRLIDNLPLSPEG